MRKTYKFSHSVCQGGYVYAHKTADEQILENKDGLINALHAIGEEFKLIDLTIKIYDTIFFFFFMTRPTVVPLKLIEAIQKNISAFGNWDQEYLYNEVYDLQEEYLRKDLDKWGYDYDEG
ncbi:MAG: hypothetical protein ABIG84_08515 [archaeon]